MKQLLKPTIIFFGLLYTQTGKTLMHDFSGNVGSYTK